MRESLQQFLFVLDHVENCGGRFESLLNEPIGSCYQALDLSRNRFNAAFVNRLESRCCHRKQCIDLTSQYLKLATNRCNGNFGFRQHPIEQALCSCEGSDHLRGEQCVVPMIMNAGPFKGPVHTCAASEYDLSELLS